MDSSVLDSPADLSCPCPSALPFVICRVKMYLLWVCSFYPIGPRIIIEQECSVDQFLLKNISVKVRENGVRSVAILVVGACQCHLAGV